MKLTPRQREANELLQSEARHILLDGGSRSGKTFLIVRSITARALKAPRSRHAIMRFRFKHCKESIGLDTLPAVMRMCWPDIPYNMNKSDWYATFPNGSEIWLGGLDEKERTEQILGKEFATIYLNECSQIPFSSRNMAVTRLAQNCTQRIDGVESPLPLRAYYDCNPPAKSHWIYRLFYQKQNPETRSALPDPGNYAALKINPADNSENLPQAYLAELAALPDRLQKRFLRGEYGDAIAGALWTEEIIDRYRVTGGDMPDMQRIVVAVDPSGSGDVDNAHNDAIGIVVAGLATDGNGYLLEDLTVKAGPKVWGNLVASAYDRHGANMIVGEVNYGGEMVKFVVQTAKPNVPFQKITASRGKAVRAEPIAALTEQGKIRFAGTFSELEEELAAMTTNGYVGTASPNRADAFVWAFSYLFPSINKMPKMAPLPLVKTGIM